MAAEITEREALALAFEVISNEKHMMESDARLILAHALVHLNNRRLVLEGELKQANYYITELTSGEE